VIPKLYDEDYYILGSKYGVLTCNGYGFLNTCQKCFVEEKTSGVYTLEMELLTTDRYAENVLPNTFVKIIPNKMHDPQLFQIYRVKEEGKKLSVSGYHIKYLAENNMISRYNAYVSATLPDGKYLVVPKTQRDTARDFLESLKKDRFFLIEDYSNSTIPIEFQRQFNITADTNIEAKTIHLRKFTNKKLGDLLTDNEYGMGQYGGEWLYNNFDLTLKKKRGKYNAVKLRYGYDLKNVTIEYSSDNNYNVVVPYGRVRTSDKDEFYLGGTPVFLNTAEVYKYPRLRAVDVSEHLPELIVDVTSSAAIGAGMEAAFNKINEVFSGAYYRGKYHARGYEIAVTAELNYESKTVQGLGLYDPVVLVTEKGREISSKVNGVTFDALNEKIVKINLDNKPLTLQDMILKKRR
jgi:phage-related protein